MTASNTIGLWLVSIRSVYCVTFGQNSPSGKACPPWDRIPMRGATRTNSGSDSRLRGTLRTEGSQREGAVGLRADVLRALQEIPHQETARDDRQRRQIRACRTPPPTAHPARSADVRDARGTGRPQASTTPSSGCRSSASASDWASHAGLVASKSAAIGRRQLLEHRSHHIGRPDSDTR